MFRLCSNLFLKVIFPLLICTAWVCTACTFIDLRPIGYTLSPKEPDSVLPEPFTPLSIHFNTDMERKEVERCLSVSSKDGSIEGDLHWEGSRLVFVPLAPWKAGIRYNLSLKGLVHAQDGRELRLSVDHPFYGLMKGEAPILVEVQPVSGASVPVLVTDTPTAPVHGPPLVFRFSQSMNPLSVQDALTIEGIDDLIWLWEHEAHQLTLVPQKPLTPWMVYRWTLKASATNRDGIPLGKEASGTFLTNLETERPRVERSFCMAFSGTASTGGTGGSSGGTGGTGWVDLGRDLNDLDLGQAIGVSFTKTMNRDSLLQSIRLEPSISGYALQIDERTVAYILEHPPEPEKTYVLVISGDTKDLYGLRLEQEYREVFTPSIPYLQLLSIQADGHAEWNGPFVGTHQETYACTVQAPDGLVAINLHFSLPFSTEAKTALLKQVTLSAYFPGSLPPVALRTIAWISDSTLRLLWEGLEAGSASIPHYYRLNLPGGRTGITTGMEQNAGYWMKESLSILLEAR